MTPRHWYTSAALCLACGHRWQAVYECEPIYLQCPACKKMEGVRDD